MSLMTFLIILWQVAQKIALLLLRFSIFVAITYALIYVVFRRFFAKRKIQHKPFNWKAFRHDALFAALNLSTNMLIGMGTAYLLKTGVIHVEKGSVSGWTIAWQFGLYFVLFDLYFYSMHRLLHTKWLHRKIHRFHHRSTSPTPLTAFAFHPVEGMLFNLFVPIMMLFLDLHIASIATMYGFGIINSLVIHSGHEMFPRNWYKHPLTSWFITPTHHDVHHATFKSNFGGFTTIWDRVFKTEHEDFEAIFDEVKSQLDTSANTLVT
jgi:sterol desaturase/sphingolipid hydroxylase (fatty acid hydroxylase superfamily)